MYVLLTVKPNNSHGLLSSLYNYILQSLSKISNPVYKGFVRNCIDAFLDIFKSMSLGEWVIAIAPTILVILIIDFMLGRLLKSVMPKKGYYMSKKSGKWRKSYRRKK